MNKTVAEAFFANVYIILKRPESCYQSWARILGKQKKVCKAKKIKKLLNADEPTFALNPIDDELPETVPGKKCWRHPDCFRTQEIDFLLLNYFY
jgi:hypothetical protein